MVRKKERVVKVVKVKMGSSIRVLICGDRDWSKPIPIDVVVGGFAAVYGKHNVTIIHGACKGADALAGSAALRHGCTVDPYPAEWDRYGKKAGPIRNRKMLKEGKPDVVFAFHSDLAASKGTKDMVIAAQEAGVPTYVIGKQGERITELTPLL